MIEWNDIKATAIELASERGEEYLKRVNFEIDEIEKQCANDYWVDLVRTNKKFQTNNNGLVIPFLMKLTEVDPIVGDVYLCINDENGKSIDGIEIILENGVKIETSKNTLIHTQRGYVKASELTTDDEVLE